MLDSRVGCPGINWVMVVGENFAGGGGRLRAWYMMQG